MNSSRHGRTSILALLIGGVVIGLGAYAVWKQLPPAAPTSDTSEPSAEESTSDRDADSTTSTEVTYTDCGDASVCDAEYELYCAEGLDSRDWASWAEEHGYSSASLKYARTSCLQAQENLSEECRAFQDCHNSLNEELTEACGKYAGPGQVCEGVIPKPGESPLADCLGENFDELDAQCQDAYTRHEANRL